MKCNDALQHILCKSHGPPSPYIKTTTNHQNTATYYLHLLYGFVNMNPTNPRKEHHKPLHGKGDLEVNLVQSMSAKLLRTDKMPSVGVVADCYIPASWVLFLAVTPSSSKRFISLHPHASLENAGKPLRLWSVLLQLILHQKLLHVSRQRTIPAVLGESGASSSRDRPYS